MVNLIAVIIVGAIIGYVASMIMRTRGSLLVDIVVGIAGALLAGYLTEKDLSTKGNFSAVSADVVGGRRHPAGDRQAHLPGREALTAFHSVRQTPWSGRPN